MGEFSKALDVSASGMRGQAERLRFVTENIANADTPGYRRKIVSFDNVLEAGRSTGEIAPGRVTLDQGELARIHDPTHPLADEAGYYDGTNVNLVLEIADAREAQRSYEANLKMFDQTRQMSKSLLELLRK